MTSLPQQLIIGVTGRRTLADEGRMAAAIDEALDRIVKTVAGERATGPAATRGKAPLRLVVLSPLAEGADRLVAEHVLARAGAALEAVLPLDRGEYEKDFKTQRSRSEFRDLLARARAIHELPRAANREDAYASAGRFVVDHCDVLVAVWDGRPGDGPGGTAETVAYARKKRRRLLVIEP